MWKLREENGKRSVILFNTRNWMKTVYRSISDNTLQQKCVFVYIQVYYFIWGENALSNTFRNPLIPKIK